MATEEFEVIHETGATWAIAANAKRGADFATKQAALFARNYCLRHGLRGDARIVSRMDGREFKMHDYVCPVDPVAAIGWAAKTN